MRLPIKEKEVKQSNKVDERIKNVAESKKSKEKAVKERIRLQYVHDMSEYESAGSMIAVDVLRYGIINSCNLKTVIESNTGKYITLTNSWREFTLLLLYGLFDFVGKDRSKYIEAIATMGLASVGFQISDYYGIVNPNIDIEAYEIGDSGFYVEADFNLAYSDIYNIITKVSKVINNEIIMYVVNKKEDNDVDKKHKEKIDNYMEDITRYYSECYKVALSNYIKSDSEYTNTELFNAVACGYDGNIEKIKTLSDLYVIACTNVINTMSCAEELDKCIEDNLIGNKGCNISDVIIKDKQFDILSNIKISGLKKEYYVYYSDDLQSIIKAIRKLYKYNSKVISKTVLFIDEVN